MKKQILSLSLAAAILALPLNGAAQSARANCDAVTEAAVAGRDTANERINRIERVIAEDAATMRNCMELFSDLASRQAVIIGGFDLTPLRNRLMDKACNMIKDEINQLQNELATELPEYPAILNGMLGAAGVDPSTVPFAIPKSAPVEKSLWDKISCAMSGNC